jgi:hypothetical protein
MCAFHIYFANVRFTKCDYETADFPVSQPLNMYTKPLYRCPKNVFELSRLRYTLRAIKSIPKAGFSAAHKPLYPHADCIRQRVIVPFQKNNSSQLHLAHLGSSEVCRMESTGEVFHKIPCLNNFNPFEIHQ